MKPLRTATTAIAFVIAATAAQAGQRTAPVMPASDVAVTGSIATAARGIDTSAKEGNAEHPNFVVPNFGTTAGGPAH